MQQWVSDEVWEQLDPHAGALTRSQLNRVTAAVVAAVGLLAAAVAIDRSGLVRAHVDLFADNGSAGMVSTNPKIVDQEIAVRNTGWTTVRVVGIGEDGPGLRLLGVADTTALAKTSGVVGTVPPFELHPGQVATVAVAYRVTDCQAVPAGSFAVPVRIDRPWGTQTVSISLPDSPERTPGFTVNGPMVGWQKAMADRACGAHS